MCYPEISFISYSERLTYEAYYSSTENTSLVSTVVSRLAAATLSLAAAIDLVYHGTSLLFSCLYALGKGLYEGSLNLLIPWQHLQRVRNAIAPLLFGSLAGVLHPLFGIVVSEPAEKHAVVGILSANTEMNTLQTPCSPIQSLSMIKNFSDYARHVTFSNGKKIELFPEGYADALSDALENEKSLELMHALELVQSISELFIKKLSELQLLLAESPFHRLSGLLIPLVSLGDLLCALVAQSFFLLMGVVQLISGRSPIYMELTSNPWLHLTLMAQTLLTFAGRLIGAAVWLYSPEKGQEIMKNGSTFIFRWQMDILLSQLKSKLMEEKERVVIPVLYGNGGSKLALPTENLHQTYLIAEKKEGFYNLYWVNRPEILMMDQVDLGQVMELIPKMLAERYPIMNEIPGSRPEFCESSNKKIKPQSSKTNCVVSNVFGMLELFDSLRNDERLTESRYSAVRSMLSQYYQFYQEDFSPFGTQEKGFSYSRVWEEAQNHLFDAI